LTTPEDLYSQPHRRFNPLTGDWVLVSPHRSVRPWGGRVEVPSANSEVEYDPDCYLCPGNTRAGGARNPKYSSTFVFTNDFAALQPVVTRRGLDASSRRLRLAESEAGVCKVMCFSPRHDLTLARMSVNEIGRVVDVWAEQYSELGGLPFVNYVQIFENRGEMMGCSNPHPHGQIWANETIPNEPLKEQHAQEDFTEQYQACLLCEYLQTEIAEKTRIVLENENFLTLVPFWAVWPFEVLIVSKQHRSNLPALDQHERISLADTLKSLTTRYDNLFETLFPYSMGVHQSPTDGKPHAEWHLHLHFYPPLLRSSTIRKFMVGYEMLGGPQRDTSPEAAAATLRDLNDAHYLDQRHS